MADRPAITSSSPAFHAVSIWASLTNIDLYGLYFTNIDPSRPIWTRPAGPASVGAERRREHVVSVNGEEYLTVKEAARALGVKPATLYAYVSRGVLKSYRQGTKRRRLYRRSEVEALRRLDRGAPPEIPPADSWIRD